MSIIYRDSGFENTNGDGSKEPDLEVTGSVYENIPFLWGKHGRSERAGDRKQNKCVT